MKVLILEDNKADAGLVKRAVKKHHEAEVKVASDKEAFEKLLQTSRPEIILSDFRMPNFDGAEALKIARSKYPDIPFILVTGTLGDEMAAGMIKAGVSDLVLKNNLEALPRAIAVALREEKMAKEKEAALAKVRSNESRFRKIIEQSHDAVLLLDEEWRIKYASPSVKHVIGFEANDLVGTYGFNLPIEEDVEYAGSFFEKSVNHPGQYIHLKYRCRTKNRGPEMMEGTVVNYLTDPDIRSFVVNFRNIEERERAREAIKSSQRFHKALLENSFEGTILNDKDAHITFASPSALKILGYSSKELIGKHASDLIHEEDIDRIQEIHSDLIDNHGKRSIFKYRVQHKDGHYLHLEGSTINLLNEPNVGSLLINFRDVTAEETAKARVQDSEKFHRALLENAYDAVVVINSEGTYSFVSPSCEKLTGYTTNEMLGLSALELVYEDDLAYVNGKFEETVASPDHSVTLTYRVKKKNGEIAYFEAYGINLMNDERVKGIVVNFRDVTEKKLIEDHRKQLSEIIESGADFISMAEMPGARLVYINQAGLNLLGLSHDYDYTNNQTADFYPPEVKELRANEIYPALQEKGFWKGESKLELANGQIIPIYQSIVAHRNDAGEIQHVSTIIRDISKEKEAEQQLREKQSALEERVKEINALYEISWLLNNTDQSFEELAPSILSKIEEGFQYPDITKARIKIGKREFQSAGFKTSRYKLKEELQCNKGETGSIEVYYLQKKPTADIGPFLKEEKDLLNSIAERICVYFDNLMAWQQVEYNKNFFQTILESSFDGVAIFDEEANALYRSPVIENILGYSINEMPSQLDWEMIYEEDRPTLANIWKEVLKGNDNLQIERIRIRAKDGSYRFVDFRIYNHLDNDYIKGIVVNFRDVTEKALKDQELRKSQLQLSEAEKIANIGSFWMEIKGDDEFEINYSKQVNRIYEFEEDEPLTFDKANSLVHPDDRHLVSSERIEELITKDGKYEVEHRILFRDGRIKHIFSEGKLRTDEQGNPVQVIGTIQDITKQKESQQKLLEYAQKLDHLTNVSPGVVYRYVISPSKGQYLDFVGMSIEDVLGETKEDVEADFSLLWNKILPEEREAIFASVETAAKNKSEWEQIFRIRDRHGQVKWIKGHSIPEPESDLEDGAVAFNGMLTDITALKKAEQKIRASEDKLRKITDAVPGVVFRSKATLDGNIKFEFISSGIEDLLGVKAENVLEDATLATGTIIPEDREKFLATMKAAILNNNPIEQEFRIKNHLGEIRWVHQSSVPENSTDGERIANGILMDVTEEKRAQQYIIDSEQSFRDLFNNSIELIYIQDMDGVFIDVNEKVKEMYGYSREEIIGKTPAFLGAPGWNNLSKVMRKINEARKGAPQTFNWWAQKKNGEIFPKEVVLRKGKYFGKDVLIAIGRDITQRVNAEREIRRSELHFRQLFENSPMATILLESDGKIKLTNKEWNLLFGYDDEEANGKVAWELLVPENREAEIRQIKDYLDRKTSFIFETVRKTKDNRQIPVILYGVPVKENDEIYGYYFKFYDLTDKRVAEDELKALNTELLKHNEDLQQFAYVTSHNLRAPVANLKGLFNFVDYDKLDSQNRDIIEKCSRTTLELDTTLSQMLEIVTKSSLDTLFDEEVDLGQVLDIVKQEMRTEIMSKHATINANFGVCNIVFNYKIMRNIIYQLINNSIKYASPKRAPEINICSERENGFIKLAIADNGIGIDLEKHKERLFKMYQRLNVDIEGKGLGLYLVKKQIELGGGTIDVESYPDKGTIFNLLIPKH